MDFPATLTDQMGRRITLMQRPRRIVSLVPSQTELLAHLGLNEEVTGITKFCIHPEHWFRTKTRVGGTKQYDLAKIAALQPDLIIGNKEENDREQIEQLMQLYPVWMSDIFNLTDALQMIEHIGAITGKATEANALTKEIERAFTSLAQLQTQTRRAAYFIWRNPWMTAGSQTFINDMLQRCGFENVFSAANSRYPEITNEQLKAAKPEVILLSSEPYPFKEKHIAELQEICPDAKISLVDGEMFSWYGSRLLAAPEYFSAIIRE
ncbi:MAG: helical backbone metal receptor [Bacteroidia bacterium]|jgi:ABC-type Fe3+-hydroxamate transport system substrate-binding protein|nr:helical backbone metal receptor [Bacteroidia bacterium]